jgi:integrase
MPWQKKSKPKAERVIRHELRDGTVKEYRYKSYARKPKPKPTDTLSALLDAYRESPEWHALSPATRTSYSIYLRPLEKAGAAAPENVKRRDLLQIRDSIATQRGSSAANAFITTASAMFAWAVDREWIEHSPVTKIKPLAGGHLRAWTPDQAAYACTKLPEHLRRVVILALYTGQRRGDLCAMSWAAYDGSRIRLVQQKTKAALVIPVHPELKVELDVWKQGATALTILTNANGVPWDPHLLSYHMPAALARIDLPSDLNVHGLRKLAAANLADAGCTMHEIAAITGHESLSMVQLYTKSADQERMANAAILRLGNIQKLTKKSEP